MCIGKSIVFNFSCSLIKFIVLRVAKWDIFKSTWLQTQVQTVKSNIGTKNWQQNVLHVRFSSRF